MASSNKIARIRINLTQETAAERIGVTPQHISNIETGNSRVSLTALVAIANLMGVSVDELLCDTVLKSKPVFIKEMSELFNDCNEYEIRVLADILNHNRLEQCKTKKIRNRKISHGKAAEILGQSFWIYTEGWVFAALIRYKTSWTWICRRFRILYETGWLNDCCFRYNAFDSGFCLHPP